MLDAVGICIAYVLGILWGLYLDLNLGIVSFFMLLCVWFMIRFLKENKMRKYRFISQVPKINKIWLIMIFIFLFGMIYVNFRQKDFETYNKIYNETTNCYMQGEVVKKIDEGDYYNKYSFQNDEKKIFLLYVPNEYPILENTVIFFQNGKFEKPSKQRNRGGFDYEKYLYSQNIYGSIYIDNINEIEIIKEKEFHIISWIQNNILEILEKLLPKEHLGILLGMLIGDTSYISENIKQAFQNSGITHLLAVSGSNVTYVILVTKFMFQKLVGKSFSNWIIIVMIILFVLISGASPSVVRAGLMAIILILSEILARAPNTYSTVATTAILILLYNPFIICDIGFVLSFGGTLGIIFFNQLIGEKISKSFPNLIKRTIFKSFVDMLSVTLAAQIFLLPIMCFYFNQISFISIITNLIVGPITGVITVLGLIIYFLGNLYFPVAKILSYSIYCLISFLIFVSNLCSNVPYGNMIVPTPSILEITLYYFVLYRFFYKKENKSSKYVACIKLVIISLSIIELLVLTIPAGGLTLNMIDVSQGDSLLFQTIHGKNILIDGGGSENSDYDVGEKVLVPYLLDQTNGIIDCMIISHFHEDHAEGCLSVLEKLKVKQIIIGTQPKLTDLYKDVLKIAKEKQIPIIIWVSGNSFIIDDLKIEVLYPNKNLEILEDLNNNSLVLKVTYGSTKILITGDIEREAEEIILKNDINVNILKIAHHGSKTSSISEFLKQVSPKVALISVGENNKFNHPNDEVLKRLEENNIKIFRTDKMGEISLKINKNGTIKIKTKL